MSTEEIRAIARQHMAWLDQRDLDRALEQYTADARCHGFAPEVLDRVGYKHSMSLLFAAFPDSHFTVDDMIAEGEKVAIRHSLHGTHQGEFQGILPTGKQVTVSAIGILRVVNGEIAESWLNADFLGLMQQLGVVPPPVQAVS
jgi:predicted ester cyclase